jgi:hypothetical protein
MKSGQIFGLLLGLMLGCIVCHAQGMSEYGGTQAMSAGLGAGLAASLSNSHKVISRSYGSVVRAQQALAAQTKAVQDYMQYGCKLETQKKWADAERSFRYVLQIIARRDGPGSVKSVPTLEHLVTVTKAQNKLSDAINFQDTVLAFKQAVNPPKPNEVVGAQQALANLLEQNNDYNQAASVWRESISYYSAHPSLPRQDKLITKSSYIRVLRKLHRDEEADDLEAENAAEEKLEATEPSIKPAITTNQKPETSEQSTTKPVAANDQKPATSEQSIKSPVANDHKPEAPVSTELPKKSE